MGSFGEPLFYRVEASFDTSTENQGAQKNSGYLCTVFAYAETERQLPVFTSFSTDRNARGDYAKKINFSLATLN